MAFTFFLLRTLLLTICILLAKAFRRPGWRDLDRTARRSLDASPPQRDHPSLHALPPEILEKIVRSACIDGGRTGCSLSLVSKRVRAVSAATRYHSIFLLAGSSRKLRDFIECFERGRSAARASEGSAPPRIRHICLSLYPTIPTRLSCPLGEQVLELHGWLDTASAVQYGDEGWMRYRQHALNEYYAAVQVLFQMVSGDLHSMCLFGRTEWWEDDLTMPAIACSGFPILTELSLSGDEPRFSLLTECSYPFNAPFPGLTRLHIVADAHQNVDFQRWVDQTPRLEFMRISCCGNVYAPGWMSNFQDAIDHLSDIRTTPPRVTLLIGPAYLTRLVGLQHLYHAAAVRLRNHLRQTRVPLVFVPYYTNQDLCRRFASPAMESEQLMRVDWLARADGLQGIFMDDVWTRYKDGRIMDRIHTWWLFGEHYLEPLILL